jgi:hypothetical protein
LASKTEEPISNEGYAKLNAIKINDMKAVNGDVRGQFDIFLSLELE